MHTRIAEKSLNPVLCLLVFLALFTLPVLSIGAQSLSGRDIMQMVDDRDDGDTSRNEMIMTLTSRRGNVRTREVLSYSKDYGEDEKTVMVFLTPSDVKGVGYLTWSYEENGKDDDTWLFMPALRKVRRISGSSRNDYFMGTDFTYDDMGDREVDEDEHKLIGEETVDGKRCWVVESTPKDPNYMYSKKISKVRQDISMIVQVDYFDRQGKLLKKLVVSQIEQIDGIWTARQMKMENLQDQHTTLLETRGVSYNQEVSDALFRVSTLEQGRIR
ncbi:outer membrane lipoprotein-sorting protein [Sediminispirochaeta bajacaliforniensis]|uniref:outer membrane lipoprotein-sorting protein n=1 Tax=Sediminispirochaeta bajacaliforniensis TaxID=148 RepID=UPI0003740F8A|nr:outer membrane lipoprotein-sorting protein [Sediminispirochaeta bajacaliforniensis]